MGAISSEVRREMLEAELAKLTPSQRATYDEALSNDGDPAFALMLALQSPPGSRNTDRAFNQGQRSKMETMHPQNMAAIQRQAKAAGIETGGKYYVSGLGRYTDKAAWVSSADDVLAVAKERNLGVSGVINRQAVQKDQAPKQVDLAPDILKRLEKAYLAADTSLASKCRRSRKSRQELREKILATHGRKARKK